MFNVIVNFEKYKNLEKSQTKGRKGSEGGGGGSGPYSKRIPIKLTCWVLKQVGAKLYILGHPPLKVHSNSMVENSNLDRPERSG